MSGVRAWFVEHDTEDEWSVWRVSGRVTPDSGLKLREVKVDIPGEYVFDAIQVDEEHHPEEVE